jgi:hypothetical protein
VRSSVGSGGGRTDTSAVVLRVVATIIAITTATTPERLLYSGWRE